ncbi:MAG: hypothetical protein KIT09_15470 [Bryobacteraceae bacterium]|nr:hypothetical protein [Bryobacteraceae bacterium]
MIVYRNARRTIQVRSRLEAIQREASAPANAAGAMRTLLALGEAEAGILDALEAAGGNPEVEVRLGEAMRLLAHRGLGHPRDESPAKPLGELALPGLPEAAAVSPHEGFAYYCLFPATYAAAVRQFFLERRPAGVFVAGIRSIGATLSAVIAAELEHLGCRVGRTTVRPAGHPFDRRVALAETVQAEVRARRDAWFAVVDEGPGLSGSSFAATAQALVDAGAPEERIALFPSWDPAPEALRSAAARRRWPRHRRYVAPFVPSEHLPWLPDDAFEGSAGKWRTLLQESGDAIAVHPQHERRKYIFRCDGRRTMAKFAGLGHYGQPAYELAAAVQDAGFGPPVVRLADGFLIGEHLQGSPLEGREVDERLLDHFARYLAFRARLAAASGAASFDDLLELIEVNCREAGLEPPRLDAYRALVAGAPPVMVDGRMQPHEWVRTVKGILKTDAVDHHRDHFFPGCQDIAWDVAGAVAEFALDPEAGIYLVESYAALSNDRTLPRRLPFFTIAYLAFRLGYATMASETAGGADSARFEKLARRRRAQLQEALSGIAG